MAEAEIIPLSFKVIHLIVKSILQSTIMQKSSQSTQFNLIYESHKSQICLKWLYSVRLPLSFKDPQN